MDDLVKNWMRNRNTIELLGFWEAIYNPNSKPVEFFVDSFILRTRICYRLLKMYWTIKA